MFINDRDLLAHEPNLFRDVAWVGQRLTGGTSSVSGTTLTCVTPEIALNQTPIGPGSVAVVGGAGYEVLGVTSATQMTISRLRVREEDAAIIPAQGTGLTMSVVSFKPQIAIVHAQVLRLAGIEPDTPAGAAAESQIANTSALRLVEALGSLALIFAAASLAGGEASPMRERAKDYAKRYAQERGRVCVEMDTDADGVTDAIRSLNVFRLVRG